MIDENDWRLTGQEEYLSNSELISVSPIEYAHQKGNDGILHEHCEFCMNAVCFNSDTKWYTTKDYYRWICKDCFEDFKDSFNWKVKALS